MKKINLKKLKNEKGVTLMETIVALSMLVLGLVSALSLMTGSIVFSQTSEDSLVVVNLARENIEYLRSLRDEEGFNGLTNGKFVVISNDGELELSSITEAVEINECGACQLYLNQGRYQHVGGLEGQLTRFRRWVIISGATDQEKNIISQVYWTERGREHNYFLETHLTDW